MLILLLGISVIETIWWSSLFLQIKIDQGNSKKQFQYFDWHSTQYRTKCLVIYICFSDTDSVDNNVVDSPVPQTVDTQEVSMTFTADSSKDYTHNSSLKTISSVIGSQENSFGHRNPLFSNLNGDTPRSHLINGLQASEI